MLLFKRKQNGTKLMSPCHKKLFDLISFKFKDQYLIIFNYKFYEIYRSRISDEN